MSNEQELPGDAQATTGSRMFANRLEKNLRTIGRWARREGIGCYRLYDADMPEYALAVDIYEGEQRWVHCQEYAAPRSVDPERARARLSEALAAIPATLDVAPSQVFLKIRQRQRGGSQYGKQGRAGEFHIVAEGGCLFWVNFSDYLDTGLFLDHRLTREMVGRLAARRRFLNLFAYTGTATVYAAKGGARATTTIDLSATYLDWARRNMALNRCEGDAHRFVQADCLQWLERESRRAEQRFDLIFLDPPTASRSKRMERSFDIQRDHALLIRQAVRLLSSDGVLVFSNNYRRFRMDDEIKASLRVEDVTARTLPRDFQRNPKIHNCWLIRSPH